MSNCAPTKSEISGRRPLTVALTAFVATTAFFVVASIFAIPSPAAQATPSQSSIVSGVPWFDNSGALTNAHGGEVFQYLGTFYLIGEAMTESGSVPTILSERTQPFIGNTCYSSTDLVHWSNLGYTLQANGTGDLASTRLVERPHVLYNAAGGYFVEYMHLANNQYGDNRIGYATSATPCGQYTYQGSLLDAQLNPISSGDDNVFLDSDGTGYLLAGVVVQRLAPDFKSVVATSSSLSCGNSCEGPAVFKANGVYFYLHSAKTFWKSNDNSYDTATSMAGPWTSRGVFATTGTNTFDSQTTAVVPVFGSSTTTYIYLGDRWCDGCFNASRYVWQPLTVNGTTLTMSFHESWTLDVQSGNWNDTSGAATIDDSVQGTTADKWNYQGSWNHSVTSTGSPAAYLRTASYSNIADDYALFTFVGTQATLYSVKDSLHGIIAVSACAGANVNCSSFETNIDLYNPTRVGNVAVWTSPAGVNSVYTLKVRLTGNRNAASSGTYGVVDRVDVFSASQDDSATSPSTMTYVGAWSTGGCTGCYGGRAAYSNTTGNTVTVTFSGTQLAMYGLVDNYHGLGRLQLCDQNGQNCDSGILVNFYSPFRQPALLYQSPALPVGTHSVRITATGMSDVDAAAGGYITLDRISARG